MLIKFLKNFGVILSVFFLQLAVIPNLPGTFERLNLVLVVIIFVSVVYQFYIGVIYAFSWGFVLDMYADLPFGATLIALLITLYVVYKVFEHFLTNKSLYTLLGLIALGTLAFNFIIFVYAVLLYLGETNGMAMLKDLTFFSINEFLSHLIMNLAVGFSMFLVFHLSSHRFKAVFIDTTKAPK